MGAGSRDRGVGQRPEQLPQAATTDQQDGRRHHDRDDQAQVVIPLVRNKIHSENTWVVALLTGAEQREVVARAREGIDVERHIHIHAAHHTDARCHSVDVSGCATSVSL